MEKAEQQVLDLHGPVTPTFRNYIAGPNQVLVGMLQQLAVQPEGWHFLSGARSTGKTHLLLALLQAAEAKGFDVRYLSLGSQSFAAELINQMEPPELLLLDDISAVAQSASLQEAVFHCLNRVNQQQKAMIATAASAVGELDIQLPDLKSRLSKCQRYKITALNDADVPELISSYLQRYALPIDQKVANYLIKHGPRNTELLIKLLRSIAQTALEAKRHITVPLVLSVLQHK